MALNLYHKRQFPLCWLHHKQQIFKCFSGKTSFPCMQEHSKNPISPKHFKIHFKVFICCFKDVKKWYFYHLIEKILFFSQIQVAENILGLRPSFPILQAKRHLAWILNLLVWAACFLKMLDDISECQQKQIWLFQNVRIELLFTSFRWHFK